MWLDVFERQMEGDAATPSKGGMKGNGTNIPLWYRIPNGDCIKRHAFWGGAVNLFVEHRLQYRQFGWIVP